MVSFFLLYLGLKGDNKQLPLKLILITSAIGFLLFALQTNILLINANENFVDNSTVFNALVQTSEGAYTTLLFVFWLFVAISTLSVLFVVVKKLRQAGRYR